MKWYITLWQAWSGKLNEETETKWLLFNTGEVVWVFLNMKHFKMKCLMLKNVPTLKKKMLYYYHDIFKLEKAGYGEVFFVCLSNEAFKMKHVNAEEMF